MDFVGQRQAERLLMLLTLFFAGAGFVAGYIFSDFRVLAIINAIGIVVTVIAVVPDWPWFNRNKLTWLAALEGVDEKKD